MHMNLQGFCVCVCGGGGGGGGGGGSGLLDQEVGYPSVVLQGFI